MFSLSVQKQKSLPSVSQYLSTISIISQKHFQLFFCLRVCATRGFITWILLNATIHFELNLSWNSTVCMLLQTGAEHITRLGSAHRVVMKTTCTIPYFVLKTLQIEGMATGREHRLLANRRAWCNYGADGCCEMSMGVGRWCTVQQV